MFSGGSGRPYLVEGVGEDFFPDRLAARAVRRGDRRSATRRASSRPAGCREVEGVLIGGSGGMAVAAAIRVARAGGARRHRRRAQPRLRAAATSRGCSTTSGWPTSASCASATHCVGAVLETARGDGRAARTSTPARPVREAIALMKANGISQLPVCKNTPPFANAEVSGSVDELDADGGDLPRSRRLDMPVERVMGRDCRRSASARRSSRPSRCSRRHRRCSCSPAAGRSP